MESLAILDTITDMKACFRKRELLEGDTAYKVVFKLWVAK